jgi:hypothetical protein
MLDPLVHSLAWVQRARRFLILWDGTEGHALNGWCACEWSGGKRINPNKCYAKEELGE